MRAIKFLLYKIIFNTMSFIDIVVLSHAQCLMYNLNLFGTDQGAEVTNTGLKKQKLSVSTEKQEILCSNVKRKLIKKFSLDTKKQINTSRKLMVRHCLKYFEFQTGFATKHLFIKQTVFY